MTTIRTLRRRLDRMTYSELFDTLPDKLHTQVNARVAWAVTELTTMDGCGEYGTRGFIEGRTRQLMIDSLIVGFSAASKRFGAAIRRHARVRITPLGRAVPEAALLTE